MKFPTIVGRVFVIDRVDEFSASRVWKEQLGSLRQSTDTSAPTIFEAIQKQLGLKLDRPRGPVDTLVIDRAEKPVVNWSGEGQQRPS